MNTIEDSKEHSQEEMWTYKILGTADADKLEYILLDLEVKASVDHEARKYLPDSLLEEIRAKIKGRGKLKVYYSKQFNSFVLEPIEE